MSGRHVAWPPLEPCQLGKVGILGTEAQSPQSPRMGQLSPSSEKESQLTPLHSLCLSAPHVGLCSWDTPTHTHTFMSSCSLRK